MKAPYDQSYQPAAPILPVSLAAPDDSPEVGPLLALVDTGADGTFVPTHVIARLGVPVEYNTNVRGHVGSTAHRVAVHVVDLWIGGSRLPACEVVGDEWGDVVVLGRDVLNRWHLHLDGPGQTVELTE